MSGSTQKMLRKTVRLSGIRHPDLPKAIKRAWHRIPRPERARSDANHVALDAAMKTITGRDKPRRPAP
jgi:hypothetical protein